MTDEIDRLANELAQKIHMDCIQAVGTTGYRWDKGAACQIIKSALLAERQKAAAWRPIETAPRDGTLMLIRCRNEQEPSLARFTDNHWRNNHYGSREPYWHFSKVIYWMPLPAPPATEKEG